MRRILSVNLSFCIFRMLASAAVGVAFFLNSPVTLAQAGSVPAPKDSKSDWKQVEDAMGRPGQIQPGDVIRFGMPRKDLHVTLKGVDIKQHSH